MHDDTTNSVSPHHGGETPDAPPIEDVVTDDAPGDPSSPADGPLGAEPVGLSGGGSHNVRRLDRPAGRLMGAEIVHRPLHQMFS